jgi:hypothetical protein
MTRFILSIPDNVREGFIHALMKPNMLVKTGQTRSETIHAMRPRTNIMINMTKSLNPIRGRGPGISLGLPSELSSSVRLDVLRIKMPLCAGTSYCNAHLINRFVCPHI